MDKKIVITESQFNRLKNLIKEQLLLEDKLFNQISARLRNVTIKDENDAMEFLSKSENKPVFDYIQNAVNNSLNARVPKQKAQYIKDLKTKLKAVFKMLQKPENEVDASMANLLNGYAKSKKVNSFDAIVEMLKTSNTSGNQASKAKSIDDLLDKPMGPSNQQKQEPNQTNAVAADNENKESVNINQMIYDFVDTLNGLKENDVLTIKLPRMDTMKLTCINNTSKYSIFFKLADDVDTATEKIELPKIPEKYKFDENSPVPNFEVPSIEYINDEGTITKKSELIKGIYEWDIDEAGGEEQSDKNPSFLKLLFANLTGKKIEPRRGNIPVLNSISKVFDDRITNKLGENFIENKTVFFKPLETIELPYVQMEWDATDRVRKPINKIFELKANSEYTFRDAVKVKQFSIDSLKYGEYRVLENAYNKFRIIVKEKSTQPHTFNCDVFKYYTDAANNQKVSKKTNVLIEFLDSDGYKINKVNTN